MQTPTEIDFQGLKGNEQLRACVLKHIAVLEERYGRITACRAVIKAPSERHRTGGAYEVTIRLSLPQGREVDIGGSETADVRHADATVAVKVMAIPEGVPLPFFNKMTNAEGHFVPGEMAEKSANVMLDELVKWQNALKVLRT